MKIQIKKIHQNAIIPKYATPGSAGFDLHCIEDVILEPGQTKLIRTGLIFEIPLGYEMQVRPRSGLSLKTSLRLSNSPGTIDSDYRGEVCVIAWNAALDKQSACLEFKQGDKIAQGVISPIIQVEFEESQTLSETKRNAGGFGSTGT